MQINSYKNPLAVLEDEAGEHKEKMHKMELEMEFLKRKSKKEFGN